MAQREIGQAWKVGLTRIILQAGRFGGNEMIVKFVFGIFPAFVQYKEVEADREVKNYASGWNIIIEPKYECDEGILQHELQHVRQWYRNGFSLRRYRESITYRLKCELEAYLKQMKYPKCDGSYLTKERAAECLTWNRYGFNITKEQALELL